MVPIPEGVERHDEEPEDIPQRDTSPSTLEDVGFMRGSGGSASDEERRIEKRKGKERETASIDHRASSRERHIESAARSLTSQGIENTAFLTSRRMESLTGIKMSSELEVASRGLNTRDNDLTSVRERERDRRRENDKIFEKERVQRWEKEVINELDKIELEKRIESQQRELNELRALQAQRNPMDRPTGNAGNGSSDAENGRRRPFNIGSSSILPG
jgi:hypothetical protein